MADHDQPALVRLEELAQPDDRVGVEVVGGLVEQQGLGAGEEDPGQLDAAALTTRQGLERLAEDPLLDAEAAARSCAASDSAAYPPPACSSASARWIAAHRPLRRRPGRRCPSRPRPRAGGVRRRRGRARRGSGRGPAPRGRRCAGPAAGSRPRRCACTEPAAGSASPARILVRVVLPAPLRPTRPTLSPAATRKLTSSMRSRAPARTSSCWAVIMRLVSLGARIRARRPVRHVLTTRGTAMRFNPKARLDTSRVRDGGRGGGGGGGWAAGGDADPDPRWRSAAAASAACSSSSSSSWSPSARASATAAACGGRLVRHRVGPPTPAGTTTARPATDANDGRRLRPRRGRELAHRLLDRRAARAVRHAVPARAGDGDLHRRGQHRAAARPPPTSGRSTAPPTRASTSTRPSSTRCSSASSAARTAASSSPTCSPTSTATTSRTSWARWARSAPSRARRATPYASSCRPTATPGCGPSAPPRTEDADGDVLIAELTDRGHPPGDRRRPPRSATTGSSARPRARSTRGVWTHGSADQRLRLVLDRLRDRLAQGLRHVRGEPGLVGRQAP